MKVLNIIVYYDNMQEVKQYIEEVLSISDNFIEIAVVINKDSNGLAKNILHPNVKVFDFEENVGYLNALFMTIQKIEINLYDYFILSNTDIHYVNNDFFKILCKKKYAPIIGCIAPSVFSTKTKSYSNPHYLTRITKKKLLFLSNLFKHPMIAKFYLWLAEAKANMQRTSKQDSCFMYSPHGCYMIFTRKFIKNIQGFLYGVKMYSEESCVGELLNKYKLKCYYDSEFEVEHRESSVTGKVDYKRRFSLWRESLVYIIDMFYSGN